MAGRVMVVTGANAGVGRATAVESGRRGDRVALIARGERGLLAAAAEVQAVGSQAFVVPADVSDPQQVASAVERIEAEFGPIEVWVNAAFSSIFARFEQITAEEFRRATEVSYLATSTPRWLCRPGCGAVTLERSCMSDPLGVSRHPPADGILRG
jgi:NAD(P)-dependent dehydrogenase (short-subunit alcohol dehydrogenase family)